MERYFGVWKLIPEETVGWKDYLRAIGTPENVVTDFPTDRTATIGGNVLTGMFSNRLVYGGGYSAEFQEFKLGDTWTTDTYSVPMKNKCYMSPDGKNMIVDYEQGGVAFRGVRDITRRQDGDYMTKILTRVSDNKQLLKTVCKRQLP